MTEAGCFGYYGGFLLMESIMGLFDFLSPNKYAAANNAILAQHLVNNLSKEDADLFKGQILRILRAGSPGSPTDGFLMERFAGSPKLVQLNFVALAALDLNFQPTLQGGSFQSVRNPFKDIPTEGQLQIAVDQFRRSNPHIANDIGIEGGRLILESF